MIPLQNHPHAHNPWHDVEARYQPGQQVQGTVTRVTHFGVFVQVEPELEGVIYTFELGPGRSAVASFVQGQEMQLYVKSIDAGRKRMELSLEQPSMLGLLEEHTIPAVLRRSKPSSELPWPMPLPDALAQLPLALSGAISEQNGRVCPTCQHSVQDAWKYCVYCGGSLRRRCPACDSVQPDLPEARYCYECGKIVP